MLSFSTADPDHPYSTINRRVEFFGDLLTSFAGAGLLLNVPENEKFWYSILYCFIPTEIFRKLAYYMFVSPCFIHDKSKTSDRASCCYDGCTCCAEKLGYIFSLIWMSFCIYVGLRGISYFGLRGYIGSGDADPLDFIVGVLTIVEGWLIWFVEIFLFDFNPLPQSCVWFSFVNRAIDSISGTTGGFFVYRIGRWHLERSRVHAIIRKQIELRGADKFFLPEEHEKDKMNVSVETEETTEDADNLEPATSTEASIVSDEFKEMTTEDADEPELTNGAVPTIVGPLSDEPGEAATQDADKPKPTTSTEASIVSDEFKEMTTEDADEPELTNGAVPTIVGPLSDEPGEAVASPMFEPSCLIAIDEPGASKIYAHKRRTMSELADMEAPDAPSHCDDALAKLETEEAAVSASAVSRYHRAFASASSAPAASAAAAFSITAATASNLAASSATKQAPEDEEEHRATAAASALAAEQAPEGEEEHNGTGSRPMGQGDIVLGGVHGSSSAKVAQAEASSSIGRHQSASKPAPGVSSQDASCPVPACIAQRK